jgi:elongation factor 1-delta
MSLQTLAQEKFWSNKAECDDAEKNYQMRLSGAKDGKSSLAAEIAKARQHIKTSLECVDGLAAIASGPNPDLVKKISSLEKENKDLKKVTDDLRSLVIKLENRVASLEKGGPESKKSETKEEEEDDDVDLFGSDSESEDDEEKNRVRDERLAAYHAKKAKKPQVIAKTSVVLDIKPWDDTTDMDAMLKLCKTIQKDGLLWGASKLVPVGYGINKLRVMCVVEDEKVSIDELMEQIEGFEELVQSVDIDSMGKI